MTVIQSDGSVARAGEESPRYGNVNGETKSIGYEMENKVQYVSATATGSFAGAHTTTAPSDWRARLDDGFVV